MGDNFLRQQVSNAKRRRDRAAGDLKKPGLFVRPELVQTIYPIEPVGDHRFSVGDMVYGVSARKGQHIDVTDGHRKLGYSGGESAQALHGELSKPDGLGAVKLRIVDVGELSDVAQALHHPRG